VITVTVTYWNSDGDSEDTARFKGYPVNFIPWLQGLLATGAFVTGVNR
jgi:hypothetical protein